MAHKFIVSQLCNYNSFILTAELVFLLVKATPLSETSNLFYCATKYFFGIGVTG